MAAEQPTAGAENTNAINEADFAKAFQELANGERAATALEARLNEMEAKIEELLERAERQQDDVEKAQEATSSPKNEPTSS